MPVLESVRANAARSQVQVLVCLPANGGGRLAGTGAETIGRPTSMPICQIIIREATLQGL